MSVQFSYVALYASLVSTTAKIEWRLSFSSVCIWSLHLAYQRWKAATAGGWCGLLYWCSARFLAYRPL